MVQTAPLVEHPDVESQVDALRRDGYVYFPGVLDDGEIADLRAAMDRLDARPESFDRDGTEKGFAQKHIKCVFNRDPMFLRFLDMPKVIDLAEAILGVQDNRGRQTDCHIIGMTAWITGPGREDQQLHVDWRPFDLPADIAADARVKLPVMAATTAQLCAARRRWSRSLSS